MFGDPEGESGHETGPLFELAKGGSERPVSRPRAARGGALSRSPFRGAGSPNRAVSRPRAARSRTGALERSRGLRDGRFLYLYRAQLGQPHSPAGRWGLSRTFASRRHPQGRLAKTPLPGLQNLCAPSPTHKCPCAAVPCDRPPRRARKRCQVSGHVRGRWPV